MLFYNNVRYAQQHGLLLTRWRSTSGSS